MNKRHLFLTLLLLAQLGLAVGLLWGHRQAPADNPSRPLLEAGAEQVDRIVIDSGDASVELLRRDGAWRLPSLAELPADGARVAALLDSLRAVTTRWPVATSGSARARFEVDAAKFQRHLRLYAGEGLLADLYLGTSPAFRQVHVGRSGEDAVFAVQLNVSDFPARDDDWLDKSLLAAPGARHIAGPDYRLSAAADGDWQWDRDEGATSPALDAAAADGLAAALASLRVQSVVADRAGAGIGAQSPVTLTVTTGDGELTYRFYVVEDAHYVERDGIDALFGLSEYDYDRTAGVDLAALSAQGDDDQEQAPEAAPPAQGPEGDAVQAGQPEATP